MMSNSLLVRLPLIIRPTAIVIRDQQELFIVLVIDVLPGLQRVIVRISGIEDQRHAAIVAFAVYFGREAFEALHEHYRKPVRGIKRHVCEEKLTIICVLLISFLFHPVGAVKQCFTAWPSVN